MSDYVVELQNEVRARDFPAERVTEAITYILSRHDVAPGTTLTLVITNDQQVRELNAQFRDVDAVTDILSFPADPLPGEIQGEAPYLGDLIVAYPYTAHQAEESGHRLDDELVLLAIHGTLHLLGYDHDDEANQDAMWSAQAEALAASGVEIDVPRFTFGHDEAEQS